MCKPLAQKKTKSHSQLQLSKRQWSANALHWVLQALFNLGNLHRQSNEYKAAVQSYDAVLALDSQHWRSMLNKAVALMGLHEEEAAVSALKLAYTTSGKSRNKV